MQVSKAIEAGKLYRFLQCAIRMRRMQKTRTAEFSASIQGVEQSFDAQLEALVSDLDSAQTNKVISAMQSNIDPCPRCGQTLSENGQGGEYPCSACGIPLVHDS